MAFGANIIDAEGTPPAYNQSQEENHLNRLDSSLRILAKPEQPPAHYGGFLQPREQHQKGVANSDSQEHLELLREGLPPSEYPTHES